MSDYTELRRIARKHELFAWPTSLTEADADELGDALEELDTLRARVEALEAGIKRLAASADMICDDEACSPSLVRKTLRAVRDAALALLEQKP